ncbi:U2 small nuclear ribonucleoprotein A'-like [Mizuhopecten yessoensis]|uniref:U2 small nuclear ribonucleoprotein A n=1 Tax=Mizuhopecten yessoensis TaxID=6573 RepID=A0A210QBR6_MIZYE|nr:U2 small nuclear ribonucleoprotein A'-like [Mizuhopecten yessoensis]XP_021362267.1 U2 small nuclear ribonucleoprotein A'-like [Mizuhopecten yessoensis]OWF46174.1 U2 small nuclear ribonucleoprotein A' [Mizuhopecten yessoensis]
MVKLTAELIEQSAQYTNPVRDRELDLRGYKIPVIENLGATLDQFDTIDFSDNDIRKVDGFPLLRRLKCLLLNNNRIVRIAESLEECLPSLESIILTNNNMQELGDLDHLTSIKSLKFLSLLRNPVTTKKQYRLYLIHKVPQLRVLDFQRIKQKERETAAKMFKGKKGQALAQEVAKRSKTFTPGEKLAEKRPTGPSKEDVELIKTAIAQAATLDEVERLNQMLKTGIIPGREIKRLRGDAVEEEEEEMEVTNGT